MAQRFSFGQNISGAVGNTLQRNQQAQQFAQQLNRRLQQDAFNNKIRSLAQRIQAKRVGLEQERLDTQMINDALDRERQREQDALNKRVSEKQIENLQSLIDTRESQSKSGSGKSNSGAVITALQNMFPQARTIGNQLQQAEQEFLEAENFLNTAQTPEDRSLAMADLIQARGKMSALQARSEGISQTIEQLNNELGIDIDVSRVFNPGGQEETPEGNNNNSAPLDNL